MKNGKAWIVDPAFSWRTEGHLWEKPHLSVSNEEGSFPPRYFSLLSPTEGSLDPRSPQITNAHLERQLLKSPCHRNRNEAPGITQVARVGQSHHLCAGLRGLSSPLQVPAPSPPAISQPASQPPRSLPHHCSCLSGDPTGTHCGPRTCLPASRHFPPSCPYSVV